MVTCITGGGGTQCSVSMTPPLSPLSCHFLPQLDPEDILKGPNLPPTMLDCACLPLSRLDLPLLEPSLPPPGHTEDTLRTPWVPLFLKPGLLGGWRPWSGHEGVGGEDNTMTIRKEQTGTDVQKSQVEGFLVSFFPKL